MEESTYQSDDLCVIWVENPSDTQYFEIEPGDNLIAQSARIKIKWDTNINMIKQVKNQGIFESPTL